MELASITNEKLLETNLLHSLLFFK